MVFVEELVARGAYPSATEVVHDALRLLRQGEHKLESLRREIQIGIDELERGEISQLDIDAIKILARGGNPA